MDVPVKSRLRHRSRPYLFSSPKTAFPVPAAHVLVRDALVQATLDPDVLSIGIVPEVEVEGARVPLNAVTLDRRNGACVLDLADMCPIPSVDEEGLRLIALEKIGLQVVTLTAEEIRREPRCTNARQVWSCRTAHVPVGDRLAVLQALDDWASTLDEAAHAVRSARDPIAAVLALACADLIEIDIEGAPLGLQTRVRCRQRL